MSDNIQPKPNRNNIPRSFHAVKAWIYIKVTKNKRKKIPTSIIDYFKSDQRFVHRLPHCRTCEKLFNLNSFILRSKSASLRLLLCFWFIFLSMCETKSEWKKIKTVLANKIILIDSCGLVSICKLLPKQLL